MQHTLERLAEAISPSASEAADILEYEYMGMYYRVSPKYVLARPAAAADRRRLGDGMLFSAGRENSRMRGIPGKGACCIGNALCSTAVRLGALGPDGMALAVHGGVLHSGKYSSGVFTADTAYDTGDLCLEGMCGRVYSIPGSVAAACTGDVAFAMKESGGIPLLLVISGGGYLYAPLWATELKSMKVMKGLNKVQTNYKIPNLSLRSKAQEAPAADTVETTQADVVESTDTPVTEVPFDASAEQAKQEQAATEPAPQEEAEPEKPVQAVKAVTRKPKAVPMDFERLLEYTKSIPEEDVLDVEKANAEIRNCRDAIIGLSRKMANLHDAVVRKTAKQAAADKANAEKFAAVAALFKK